jgi:hypothetical protein
LAGQVAGQQQFDAQPVVRQRQCVGCATGDAAKFALIDYDTGDPDQVALAAAWIYDGKTYLTLWETNQTTIDSNSTLVNSVLMGFSIQAIE